MDLAAIRTRLAAQLETVDGLFVHATAPLDPPNLLPAAIVAPATGQFFDQATMDDAADLDLVVTVLLQQAGIDPITQTNLDGLVVTIQAAIDAGHTADWDYAVAGPVTGYGSYEWGHKDGSLTFLGFQVPVGIGVN